MDRPQRLDKRRDGRIFASLYRGTQLVRDRFPELDERSGYGYTSEQRGEEHGSYIIEGLETGRVYRGHFNVVNQGIISNLPDDAIIEAPGYVDRNGISMPHVGICR